MTVDTRSLGASQTLLACSTNTVLKAGNNVTPSPGPVGIFRKITCLATNTSVAFINDGTGTASGSSTIWAVNSGGMAVGAVTTLDWTLNTGLAFVPGGGSFSLAWD